MAPERGASTPASAERISSVESGRKVHDGGEVVDPERREVVGDTRQERFLIGPVEGSLHEIDVARAGAETLSEGPVRARYTQPQAEYDTHMACSSADCEVPGVVQLRTQELVESLAHLLSEPSRPLGVRTLGLREGLLVGFGCLSEELAELRELRIEVPLKKWNRVVKNVQSDRKLVGGLLLDFANHKERVSGVVGNDRLSMELRRTILDATVTLLESEVLMLALADQNED